MSSALSQVANFCSLFPSQNHLYNNKLSNAARHFHATYHDIIPAKAGIQEVIEKL